MDEHHEVKKPGFPGRVGRIAILLYALAALMIVVLVIVSGKGPKHTDKTSAGSDTNRKEQTYLTENSENTEAETEVLPEAPVYALQTEEADVVDFAPHCTDETKPSAFINSTAVSVNGSTIEVSDYKASRRISFGKGSAYTELEGVITFRGNNYRNSPAYGLAELSEYKLEGIWSQNTGAMEYNGKVWSGSGWTGQPLLVKWPKATKAVMNMKDWAKEKEDLVEVIYACMDGYVYFLDLETGEQTRSPMYLGFAFKGAGALDPRGYPILYLGAGYTSERGKARVFVVNLLDCSTMYTFGNDDPFAFRSTCFFDSSCLVDAKTDTLIYPGENGILYLVHLNSAYDEAAGTLTIDPDETVKWHYQGNRTTSEKYWIGMEDSAAVYDGYLYIADNGGNLMCLNINTLETVWVQDTLDDTNGSPVLSVEDGHLYIYISTSFHLGWRSSSTAEIPIWKIDAEDGHVVWHTSYECSSVDGASGGVQSTIALGRNELDKFIYVTVGRTGGGFKGVLACLSKKTGEIGWEHRGAYTWSSPVCVYNSDGSGNILYCASNGKMYLLDGLMGDVKDEISLSDGTIEASPAVYNDTAVVGTRAGKIWGIKLK